MESQIAQRNAFSALNINTISSKVCVANTGKSVNASDLNIHLLIFCILRNSINAYTAGSAAKVSAFPHCGSWISCKSEMCLCNVLVNLILQVMGCIMNYYQLSILLWVFFPAKCAILFISLAIILVLLPYTHTHWQASKTWPVMCFYKNIFIYIYIISVCVSASISQCRPSCLLLNCCLFLLFFLFLLLLWGVWQVISILGSGTYPPLTCTDSNVNTTLACAQLVKKKKKCHDCVCI